MALTRSPSVRFIVVPAQKIDVRFGATGIEQHRKTLGLI